MPLRITKFLTTKKFNCQILIKFTSLRKHYNNNNNANICIARLKQNSSGVLEQQEVNNSSTEVDIS